MSSNESTPSPTMAPASLTETVPMRVPQTAPSESAQNVEEEVVKASIPEASSGKGDESVSKVKEDVSDEDEDESESDDEPPVWKGGMARGRIAIPSKGPFQARPSSGVSGPPPIRPKPPSGPLVKPGTK